MMTEDEPIRIPITDVLDLHTFAPRDAKTALEAYLEEAQLLGFKALRIIHGRGIGVQREMVRRVLSQQCSVVEYGDAPQEAGGWRATTVTMAKKPHSHGHSDNKSG